MSRPAKTPSAVWDTLKSALERMDSSASFLKSLAVNAALLTTFIVVLPLIFVELFQSRTIIEPIGVPQDIAALGLTSEAAANQLWDGLADVKAAARTDKRELAALPASQRVQFEFPDSGLSFDSLIHHARRFLGMTDRKIGGEFVCDAAPCTREGMRLRLRITGDRTVNMDLPPAGAQSYRAYFRAAALMILRELDPFVAAAAQIEDGPAQALGQLRRIAAARHPDAKWAHNLIGLAQMNQDQLAGAQRAFDAALAIDPAFLPALINKSLLLSKTGDASGAQKIASLAAAIAPRDVRTWMALAEAAFAKGDIKSAIALCDQAAAANPASPWPLVRKGLLLAGSEPAKAGDAYRAALERDPDAVEAHLALAAMALTQSDHATALKHSLDIARVSPDDAKAHANAAALHAIMNQRSEAITAYGRALALTPNDGPIQHSLGQLLRDTGDLAGAEAMLTAAARSVPAALFDLGDTLQRKGQTAQARETFNAFLAQVQNSPYRALAEAHLKRLAN